MVQSVHTACDLLFTHITRPYQFHAACNVLLRDDALNDSILQVNHARKILEAVLFVRCWTRIQSVVVIERLPQKMTGSNCDTT